MFWRGLALQNAQPLGNYKPKRVRRCSCVARRSRSSIIQPGDTLSKTCKGVITSLWKTQRNTNIRRFWNPCRTHFLGLEKRTCPGKRGHVRGKEDMSGENGTSGHPIEMIKYASNSHGFAVWHTPDKISLQGFFKSWQLCHVYTIGYVARPRNKLYIKLVDICHTQMKYLPWQTIRWTWRSELVSCFFDSWRKYFEYFKYKITPL